MYERYVRLRNKRKVTDYRVVAETGISRSTFTDWKTGRSKPKLDKLLKIVNYFGVSIEYFINDED